MKIKLYYCETTDKGEELVYLEKDIWPDNFPPVGTLVTVKTNAVMRGIIDRYISQVKKGGVLYTEHQMALLKQESATFTFEILRYEIIATDADAESYEVNQAYVEFCLIKDRKPGRLL